MAETDVKSARRVLDIFQLFAEMRRPASLALISKRLNFPKSSCVAILKTLEANGYLYCVNDAKDYYPTRRILDEAKVIISHDPLLSHLRPILQALAAETGETVFLAKRDGLLVHYLEVVESQQTLRYAASVGEKRPLHIGAAGQCLLAAMDDGEREELISQLPLEKFSTKTVTSCVAYSKLIAQGKARGWFMSSGGYQEEVASIGNHAIVNGEVYAVVVGGPVKRLTNNAESIGRTVSKYCDRASSSV